MVGVSGDVHSTPTNTREISNRRTGTFHVASEHMNRASEKVKDTQ